jgi:NAD(P)H-dependent FMN reductase
MVRIAIILGSSRPHRRGAEVAEWAYRHAVDRAPAGIEFELVDLADFALPVLDEPAPAIWGVYEHAHTRAWSRTIDSFDGFVFVLAEYNHGVPGPLKNAIDYLFAEWNNKSAGFISYGVNGGVRAVEQMRGIAGELQLADVRHQVALSTFTDFDYEGSDPTDPTATGRFAPDARHTDDLSTTLHQVVTWAEAMASVRDAASLRA